MNCLWNVLFRKIVFEIFCSGKLFFVLELWILKYFEHFLVKNICTKCSWLSLRFTDWHLSCSIALLVSLDFCDKRSTVWYFVTNPWVDWLIDQLFAWTSWLKAIAISFQNLFILEVELWKSSPIEVDMNWLRLLSSIIEFVSGLIDIHQGTWILWAWLWFLLELLNFICIWKLCWNWKKKFKKKFFFSCMK